MALENGSHALLAGTRGEGCAAASTRMRMPTSAKQGHEATGRSELQSRSGKAGVGSGSTYRGGGSTGHKVWECMGASGPLVLCAPQAQQDLPYFTSAGRATRAPACLSPQRQTQAQLAGPPASSAGAAAGASRALGPTGAVQAMPSPGVDSECVAGAVLWGGGAPHVGSV